MFFSASETAQAIKIGDKNYKTSIYLGPNSNFNKKYIKELIKKNVDVIKSHQIEDPEISNSGVERLLILAHGNVDGSQMIGTDDLGNNLLMRVDDFANKLFPDAKIIHSLGCFVGANAQQRFKQNSLKKDQILFLHSGNHSYSTPMAVQTILRLNLEQNAQLPPPFAVQIIRKESTENIIFAEMAPVAFEDIVTATKDGSKQEKTDNLYRLITQHTNKQMGDALQKFSQVSDESKKIIHFELERLGFGNSIESEESFKKDQLIKNYLEQYLAILSSKKNNPAECAEAIINSGIIDLNNPISPEGSTLLMIAIASNNIEFIELLIRSGAKIDKATNLGTTPLTLAIQLNNFESFKILIGKGANVNALTGYGETPAMLAIQDGRLEFLEVLVDKGADLNLGNSVGGSIFEQAVRYFKKNKKDKSDCKKMLIFLAKNGADPRSLEDDYYSKADDYYSKADDYYSKVDDINTLDEMKEAWLKYNQKPQNYPRDTSAKNLGNNSPNNFR